MQILTNQDGTKEVYLNKEEYQAFEIVQMGREFEGDSSQGLPASRILKELKQKGLHAPAIRAGQIAYGIWKNGGSVYQGGGVNLPDYM